MLFLKNFQQITLANFSEIDTAKTRKTISELIKYALNSNIEVYRIFPSKSIFILKKGVKTVWIHKALTSKASPIGVNVARDKHLTKELLGKLGYPVASGIIISSEEELAIAKKNIRFPVVVKPASSSEGRGITINVNDDTLLLESFISAKKFGKRIIIEKHIPGDYYRLTYIADGSFAAVKNLPAYITGNGSSTARELIYKENLSNEERGRNLRLKQITVSEKTRRFLASAGYSLHSVIRAGEKIPLCFGGFDGGEYIDVTETIHTDFIIQAGEISAIIDLPIIGIDIVTTDIARPLKETGGVIIEINGTFPDIQIHTNPTKGVSRNLAPNLINYLFK